MNSGLNGLDKDALCVSILACLVNRTSVSQNLMLYLLRKGVETNLGVEGCDIKNDIRKGEGYGSYTRTVLLWTCKYQRGSRYC